jgi:predicted site-specific integrase-resolvase
VTIGFAQVSSHDQRADLDRQKLHLLKHAQRRRLPVDQVIAEVGSGLDTTHRSFPRHCPGHSSAYIVVEHCERLARFGFEKVDPVLRARGGGVLVLEEREVDDELVCDMTEVLTGLCARLHGRRSAQRRAHKAMEAARQ